MRDVLDRKRFPWVTERREPTPSERHSAIIASAALMATQRVATSRRIESKRNQEAIVAQALLDHGLVDVTIPGGSVATVTSAPHPGSFCPHETVLGGRKADLLVGLWDGRVMPIECKVSNSSLNSVKRLNNDAAAKAEAWVRDFGLRQIVPVAVLSGVFKLRNLQDAQDRGLTLYWAHRLDELTAWIDLTRAR